MDFEFEFEFEIQPPGNKSVHHRPVLWPDRFKNRQVAMPGSQAKTGSSVFPKREPVGCTAVPTHWITADCGGTCTRRTRPMVNTPAGGPRTTAPSPAPVGF